MYLVPRFQYSINCKSRTASKKSHYEIFMYTGRTNSPPIPKKGGNNKQAVDDDLSFVILSGYRIYLPAGK